MIRIPFFKYEAAGNDFLVVCLRNLTIGRPKESAGTKNLAALARAILARHSGVGADGLFVASPPKDPANQLAVRIFNADGSEAEMSGNGIRCAAAWLLDERSRTRKRRPLETLSIETAAGLRIVEVRGARRGIRMFRVNMGTPILEPSAIPFAGEGALAPVKGFALPVSQGTREVTVTSMGNPHCSMFVRSFDDLNWRALGREIERHPLFPNRTNVEFVRVVSERQIEVRYWERGVGETASSGTGSSAAAVASALNGLTGRTVRVNTAGGELEVHWSRSGAVYLTGPVRYVCRGSYDYSE